MRLEDAMLCFSVDCRGFLPREAAELCREAIAGGADIIDLGPGGGEGLSREMVERVASVCREEDALLVVRNEPSLAREVGTGVLLTRPDFSVGYVRSILPAEALVGLAAKTRDEVLLALDMQPDFVVYFAGLKAPLLFSRLRSFSSVLIFAGGIQTIAEAGRIVEQGMRRLCLDFRCLTESVTESIAEVSRLLGRRI